MNPSEFWRDLRAKQLVRAYGFDPDLLGYLIEKIRDLDESEQNRLVVLHRTEVDALNAKSRLVHIHPSDDPWSRTCRTLCGTVVQVRRAITPRGVHAALRAASPNQDSFFHSPCNDCLDIFNAWKISGNGKPLTYRRLNAWPVNAKEIQMPGEEKSTQRAQALERAIAVRRKEVRHAPELEFDSVYILLGELLVCEHERALSPPWEPERRRALTVDLVRAKPSPAVLRALQGV